MSGALHLDNPFWRFSLSIYAAPGVERECLGLQRELGIDVNLLLFCGWCGQRGRKFIPAQFEHLKDKVRALQVDVIQALRASRNRLKELKSLDEVIALALSKEVAAIEFHAEQVEQAILYAAEDSGFSASTNHVEAINANLDIYLAAFGRDHTAASSLIAALRDRLNAD